MYGLMPVSDWKPTPVSQLPQDWSQIKRISLDVETKDPDIFGLGCGARRPGCHVVGFGIGFDLGEQGKRCYYLPVRHEDGGNLEFDSVRRYLDDNLKTYRGRIVGAELSYDSDYMMQEGIRFVDDLELYDVATTDSLIDEYAEGGFTLDHVAKRYGYAGKDEQMFKAAASFYGAKGENLKSLLYRLHSKYVGAYAERDVELPFLIDDAQTPIVAAQELGRAVQVEAQVLPVTVLMRRHGIRVNMEALDRVEKWAFNGQLARLAQFTHLTGISITMDDARSPMAMQSIITRLGLPPLPITRRWNKKKKCYEEGQPEMKAEVLKAYRDVRVDLIADARKLDKIITTYGPSIRKYQVNGKVHGTLKTTRGTREGAEGDDDDQSGTVSRRMAHVHPNLGNQPNPTRDEDDALRVEMGTLWRSIFEPDDPESEDWGLADFSQQEPRWIVHDAEGQRLRGARQMAEAFRNDPRTDNHKAISELTKLPRGPAKITFLARCYGAGMAKIAMQMEDKLRELDKLIKAGDPKTIAMCGPDWPLLPDGWTPTHEDVYKPGDWVPPHKCVGDLYDRPDPICAAIIKRFDDYAPYVKELSRMMAKVAKERGYIKLIDGGRARLERDAGGNLKDEHKGLNRRAQGNGAVQLKLALIALRRAGLLPNMTVHDDVSKSVPKGERGTRMLLAIKEICEGVVPYVEPSKYDSHPGPYKSRIPWLVKVKRGASYGTADSAKEIMVAAA